MFSNSGPSYDDQSSIETPPVISPHPTVENPVLTGADVTDRDATGVADPFLTVQDGTYLLFFEVITNQSTESGYLDEEIGYATSEDGYQWEYQHIIVDEPGHFAYPYVFKRDGEWYMTCDNGSRGHFRIYRADPFPTDWHLIGEPLQRPGLVDPTPFYWNGCWYMLAGLLGEVGAVALYVADELLGPWTEHPASPVHEGNRMSRPAGRPIVHDDYIDFFFQDGRRRYGDKTRAVRITELTRTDYNDTEYKISPIAGATFNGGWNHDGMHHVDAGLSFLGIDDIVAVDGIAADGTEPYSIGIYTREA